MLFGIWQYYKERVGICGENFSLSWRGFRFWSVRLPSTTGIWVIWRDSNFQISVHYTEVGSDSRVGLVVKVRPGFCMDSNEQGEQNQDGPDIFGYYCRGVTLLLAGNDDWSTDVVDDHTKSNSVFGNRVPEISKKEILESFLTQAAIDLSTEFDEVRQSVLKLHEVITILRRNGPEETPYDPEGSCHKKIKMTATGISIPRSPVIATSGESSSNTGGAKSQSKEHRGGLSEDIDHGSEVEDADLRLVLENNGPVVELLLKKYLDEQYEILAYMMQQMNKLLDEVFSLWRPMTLPEKQQLQKLIKELPEQHLADVAELLTDPEVEDCSEFFVDLDKKENRTLWKIYYIISKNAPINGHLGQ
ncbi:hypothetical protein MLD38_000137 [Melastoma candidum]|uniref:Uncharacterized protein n=1 Tax=Melastoma candidum TaxID=119954 RepID=A0ACB9SHQ2_9MYRT|nr:hypothetical protein MLD38_000137 [Melastoma candidum]